MPWDNRTKRQLKLRDLDILVAVVEMQSMGKAASRLNISQPAISKAIMELEHALGVPLVERSRRGVVPTSYGSALRKWAATIFNDLRQGIEEINFISDPTKGEIRLGATEPVTAAIISPVIGRLARTHPGMSFHVVAGDTAGLYKNVAERNIELAICRMIGPLPNELTAEILFYDSFAIMASAKNPLTRRRQLKLADLMNERWALLPFDSFFGSLVAEAFRTNGHQPPRATVATLSEYMKNDLLATGRFLTVLPSFMLKVPGRHPPLRALSVALLNPRMPIGLITLKNRMLTPVAQLFIDNIRSFTRALAKS